MENFFEYQGKMFLNIEKFLGKLSEEQPYMHYLIVFLHIFVIKMSSFYWLCPKKYKKTRSALNSS